MLLLAIAGRHLQKLRDDQDRGVFVTLFSVVSVGEVHGRSTPRGLQDLLRHSDEVLPDL